MTLPECGVREESALWKQFSFKALVLPACAVYLDRVDNGDEDEGNPRLRGETGLSVTTALAAWLGESPNATMLPRRIRLLGTDSMRLFGGEALNDGAKFAVRDVSSLDPIRCVF
jgi:hypothetical protein